MADYTDFDFDETQRAAWGEFADRLGVTDASTVVTLGEGGTPLFAALLTAADKLGMQYVATAHRARVETGADGVHTVCPPCCSAQTTARPRLRLEHSSE